MGNCDSLPLFFYFQGSAKKKKKNQCQYGPRYIHTGNELKNNISGKTLAVGLVYYDVLCFPLAQVRQTGIYFVWHNYWTLRTKGDTPQWTIQVIWFYCQENRVYNQCMLIYFAERNNTMHGICNVKMNLVTRQMSIVEQELLTLPNHNLVFFLQDSCYSIFSFLCSVLYIII